MTITVNEKEYQFNEVRFLVDVLSELDISQNGIAVAVNQEIIPRTNWSSEKINNNDKILIIKATQGG